MVTRRNILRGLAGLAAGAVMAGKLRSDTPDAPAAHPAAPAPASRPAAAAPAAQAETRPAAVATASDWPAFRGDQALTGAAPGELADRFRLKWKFKTKGEVRSSPVIAGGRVFAGSGDSSVYCLDFADGKKLWAFQTNGAVDAPALVLDGRVYVGSSDSFVYALDAATGKEIWKHETGEKIMSSPNWTGRGDKLRVIVGCHDGKVYCIDAGTGKRAWVYPTDNIVNGTPAIRDGQVAFAGCDGFLHLADPANGAKIKDVEVGAFIMASMALADGRAYMGNYEGKLLCVDLKSGKVLWQYSQPTEDRPFGASPALAGGRVIIGGQDSRVHCVQAATGKGVWTFAARDAVDSNPLVCGDKVVVGSDDGRLYVLAVATGRLLWSYNTGEPIRGGPGIAAGTILVGSDSYHVYAFEGAR